MNRRKARHPSVRTDRVFGVASATSVKRRQRPRRGRPVKPRQAAVSRAESWLHEWIDRWAEQASERHANGPGVALVGLDVARPPSRLQTRSFAPFVLTVLAGALFLAALRMDVIRMRFDVAHAFEEEVRLEDVKRELTVEMRRLRDPALLAERAEKLGFRRAESLIDLDRTTAPGRAARRGLGRDATRLASATRSAVRRP